MAETKFKPSAALSKSVHANGGLVSAGIITLILFQICWVLSGLLFTKMMDEYQPKYTWALGVVLISAVALTSFQDLIDMKLIPNLYNSMNNDFVTALLETFETKRTSPNLGKAVSLFTHLHYNSVELFMNIREYMVPAVISICIGICAFFYIDRTLGMTFGAAVLLFAGLYTAAIYIMKRPGIEMEECRMDQDETTSDMLLNMHNIFAVNNTKGHLSSFHGDLNRCKQKDEKYFSSVAGARSLLMVALTIVFVAPLLVLIKLSRNRAISIGSFAGGLFILAFIREYLFSTINHIGNMSWYSSYLIQADKNVEELLASTEVDPLLNYRTEPPADNTIILKDANALIKFPDLTIAPGDRLVLRGPIGSGKSTLLNVLFGKLPYTGSVTIGGIEVRELNITVLRNYIILVPQTVSLFQNTLYYNISYGNDSTREQVQALLDKFNITFATLDEDMGRLGERLSGGQRQLVFLLRALLNTKDFKIVLMDEPTSALDPKTRQIALQIIEELIGNRTAIIVTHDEALEKIATNVLHLSAA